MRQKRVQPCGPEQGLLSLGLSFHISVMGSGIHMALVSLSQHNTWNCLAQCCASSRYPIDPLSFFLHCRGDSPASCPCSHNHSLELQFIRRAQKILLIYAPFIPLDNAFGKMWGACVHLIQASQKQAQLLTLPERMDSLHLTWVITLSLSVHDAVHLLQLMIPQREISEIKRWSLIWQEFLGLLAWVSVTPSGESVTAYLYNTYNEAQNPALPPTNSVTLGQSCNVAEPLLFGETLLGSNWELGLMCRMDLGFELQFHLLWLWTNKSISLSLSFLTSKVGRIVVPFWESCFKNSQPMYWEPTICEALFQILTHMRGC